MRRSPAGAVCNSVMPCNNQKGGPGQVQRLVRRRCVIRIRKTAKETHL
jgi:hypothetical protein